MNQRFSLVVLLLFSAVGIIWSDSVSRFKEVIVPLLVVIMLSMGLTLTAEDFKRILKRPHIILYGALLQFSVMPMTGFFIAKLFGYNPQLLAGVVLVGSAPGGTASNLITYLSGGNLPYSVSMTALSTLLSPLFTPLWTLLLAGKYVPVPFTAMALTTLKIVILPVLSGMTLRVLLGERVKRLEPLLPYLAVLAIGFIISVIFAVNKEKLFDTSLSLFIGVNLHILIGFALGFLLGKLARLDNQLAKTLSIEVGMQNSGLSAVLAMKFFSPLSALPSALFSLMQNLIGLLLSPLFRKL